MRLRHEALIGIGGYLLLQVLLSLLAIGLLNRMGPAIGQILNENIACEESIEEMLAILAIEVPGPIPRDFTAALVTAQDTSTSEEQLALISRIRTHQRAAFLGKMEAKRALISALRGLGEAHREAMTAADLRAHRVAQSGAWAAAILGSLGLALGIFFYRHLRLRIEGPIEALQHTTHQIRDGNRQARCTIPDAPVEILRIANNLNWILDGWLNSQNLPLVSSHEETDLLRVIGWLLDRHSPRSVLRHQDGEIVSAPIDCVLAQLSPHTSEVIEGTPFALVQVVDAPGTEP